MSPDPARFPASSRRRPPAGALAALCVGLGLACSGRSEESLPPVVALVTVDTWRADHLDEARTPNLWRLASEGERFTNAWSPMGLTTPAHATMLSGLPPWEHGARANNHHGYALAADLPLVQEHADFEGWARGAFVSAFPAGPEGGLDRGWEVFDGPESGERSGEVAVSAALAWLPRDRPALLWVHVYEPHGPYEGRSPTEAGRYAEEVRRADALLEPLLDELVSRGARIVVASDHGEVHDEERCGWQHERSSHEAVLRVPLFRWSPERPGTVSDALVGLADVPALLRGEAPTPRSRLLAESGTCEPGCTGCAPEGLTGRDAVALDAGGRWTRRPGHSTFSSGSPGEGLREHLDEIPAVSPPGGAPDAAELEALGYQVPPEPPAP